MLKSDNKPVAKLKGREKDINLIVQKTDELMENVIHLSDSNIYVIILSSMSRLIYL